MRKTALLFLCSLLALGLAWAQEEKKPTKDMGLEVIEAKYAGKIDEPRPKVTYDFDPYLDVGTVLGAEYVLDTRLAESIDKVNSRLLTMHSAYLRVPVVAPLTDLTAMTLKIPLPSLEHKPVSWELVISDSRGRVFRSIKGSGRPPQAADWNGRADAGELLTVGAIYSYELAATDDVGNRTRRIIEPVPIHGIIDRQTPGWVVSVDSREIFRGANVTEAGTSYLQTITNLIKEKSARSVVVAAYNPDQAGAVASIITKDVPFAKVEIRRLSERYINIDVNFQ